MSIGQPNRRATMSGCYGVRPQPEGLEDLYLADLLREGGGHVARHSLRGAALSRVGAGIDDEVGPVVIVRREEAGRASRGTRGGCGGDDDDHQGCRVRKTHAGRRTRSIGAATTVVVAALVAGLFSSTGAAMARPPAPPRHR